MREDLIGRNLRFKVGVVVNRLKRMSRLKKVQWGMIALSTSILSGCVSQEARVDRWTDLERPCQPHGFYIAPSGDSLDDVARVCKADQAILRRYNAWLLTRQPFVQPTVVWLKQNPAIQPEDETLMVDAILPTTQRLMSSERLSPLR